MASYTNLTLFNGSPRGDSGNTKLMLEQFAAGFDSATGRSHQMLQLNHVREQDSFREAFASAECILIGFPLYTDAMPGLVKTFFESLAPLTERPANPPVLFLVQSGFPEAAHSRPVEYYLEKLARRLHSPYLGTMIKGNGEATRAMPPEANRKFYTLLQSQGKLLAEQGRLDPQLTARMTSPERFPAILAPVFWLLVRLPIMHMYWDMQLKKNNAFERRNARPYME